MWAAGGVGDSCSAPADRSLGPKPSSGDRHALTPQSEAAAAAVGYL